MRINSARLYKVQNKFKSNGVWQTEEIIAAGSAMRARGYHLMSHCEFIPDVTKSYALHDGHLPGYQPAVSGAELERALLAPKPAAVVAHEVEEQKR